MTDWVVRTWKSDGSTNTMGWLAALRNLERHGPRLASDPLDNRQLLARKLAAGEPVETPRAVFRLYR